MAVNKVEINGKTIVDLTKDTVTPENLLSGITAHNAAGEPIVGAATAGGITNFPTIAEVRANWTAVNLTHNPGDDFIRFTSSSIIFAFIIGDESGGTGILFLEVNQQDQDFDFCNLCNENGSMYVFELYYYEGRGITYDILVSDALGGEISPGLTFQNVIYYTTADNFFSK